ncbi:hypothetical protein HDU77_002767 [Chytriomyces hyalinus]|nr:hypothetical protein HDU77_002767 [Chytriomyces hyalinus]
MSVSLPTNLCCQTCRVSFAESTEQRAHFKSDWHMSNQKRRIAELEPLDLSTYTNKLNAAADRQTRAAQLSAIAYECTTCNKTYATENAHENHLLSKKHKQLLIASKKPIIKAADAVNQQQQEQQEQAKQAPEPREEYWRNQFEQAQTQDQIRHLVQLKMDESPRLAVTDCLFCTASNFTSAANAVHHMSVKHSFLIPDMEHLIDLEGLLEYLGEKISLGNMCLACNEDGPAMYSLEAARLHMVSKGHCRVAYERQADQAEIADFYDFSSTWDTNVESKLEKSLVKKPLRKLPPKETVTTMTASKGLDKKALELDRSGVHLSAMMKIRAASLALERTKQVQNMRYEQRTREFEMRRAIKRNNCSAQHFASF